MIRFSGFCIQPRPKRLRDSSTGELLIILSQVRRWLAGDIVSSGVLLVPQLVPLPLTQTAAQIATVQYIACANSWLGQCCS